MYGINPKSMNDAELDAILCADLMLDKILDDINQKDKKHGKTKTLLRLAGAYALGVLVAVSFWLMVGCSVGVHGGADFNLYYSEKSSLGISGDPYKSRGSGISRKMGTEPASAFQTFENKGDK
jgi:hypothetical protein